MTAVDDTVRRVLAGISLRPEDLPVELLDTVRSRIAAEDQTEQFPQRPPRGEDVEYYEHGLAALNAATDLTPKERKNLETVWGRAHAAAVARAERRADFQAKVDETQDNPEKLAALVSQTGWHT